MLPVGVKFDLQLPVLEEGIVGLRKAKTLTLTNTRHWDEELAKSMRRFGQPGDRVVYGVFTPPCSPGVQAASSWASRPSPASSNPIRPISKGPPITTAQIYPSD